MSDDYFTGGIRYTRVPKPPEPDITSELKKLRAAENEADSVRRSARLIPNYQMTSTAHIYTDLELKIMSCEERIRQLEGSIRNHIDFHPRADITHLHKELEQRREQLAALKAQQE